MSVSKRTMASNSNYSAEVELETVDQREEAPGVKAVPVTRAHGGPASAPPSGAAAHNDPCVSSDRIDSFQFASPSPTKDWRKKRTTSSAPSADGRSKALRQHADPIQGSGPPSESDVNGTSGSAPPSDYYKWLTKDMRIFYKLVGFTDKECTNLTYECRMCPGYKTFSCSVSSNSNLMRHYKRLGL